MGKRWPRKFAGRLPRKPPHSRRETGVVPGLTVVLVGDDPASQVYVRNKAAACKAAGMNGRRPVDFPPAPRRPSCLANDRSTQRRSGRSWHPGSASAAARRSTSRSSSSGSHPQKDVDGFHPANFGLLAAGTPAIRSLHAAGHSRTIDSTARIETRGAHAVVLGRSRIVGRPLAFLLLQKGPGETRPSPFATPPRAIPRPTRARPICCSSPWAAPSSSRPIGSSRAPS